MISYGWADQVPAEAGEIAQLSAIASAPPYERHLDDMEGEWTVLAVKLRQFLWVELCL